MIFTNLGFHVQVQLLCYEGRPDAYRTLCHLWASKEFQHKSQKERNSGVKFGKHTFEGDGYVHMSQRMVNHRIPVFINISRAT
jgi:hypothetical protein